MSIGNPSCARCSRRVRHHADHLCMTCADALGRDTLQPWWGDFPGTADRETRLLNLEPKELPNGRFQVAA